MKLADFVEGAEENERGVPRAVLRGRGDDLGVIGPLRVGRSRHDAITTARSELAIPEKRGWLRTAVLGLGERMLEDCCWPG